MTGHALLEAEVTPTYRECTHLSMYVLSESPAFWLLVVGLTAGMAMFDHMSSNIPVSSATILLGLLMPLVMCPLAVLFIGIALWRKLRAHGTIRHGFDAIGWQTVTIAHHSRHAWTTLSRVRRTRDMLLFYTDNRMTLFIPARALPSADGVETLLEWAARAGVPRIDR